MSNYRRGASTMLVEKLVKMASQLGALVLMAQYLGPQDLGILFYCYAIVSIFLFVNNLGLDTILVKKFVTLHTKTYSYLTHALFIRSIAALISILLANFVGLFLVEEKYRLLLFIISLLHLFVPLNVFEWYFQALGKAELAAISLIVANIVGLIFRVVALYLGGDLIWLGMAYSVELVIAGIFLMYWFYANKGKMQAPISTIRMKNLLREAAPLIFSGALVMLYMKVDQLMLGMMRSTEEVGLYVAATRLSEAWFFVGMTIISIYFPKFLNVLKQQGENAYRHEIVKIGSFIFWFGVLLAVMTMFISQFVIDLLYGQQFANSAIILSVSIWTVPFVYLGTISTKMYITMNKNSAIFWRSLIGLIVNIICNIPLIHYYGAIGSAISTVASQFFVGFIFNIHQKNIFDTQLSILFLDKRY